MKSTETHQTSTGETVTISRAEYEEKNARLASQDERISHLENQVEVLMEALRLARHKQFGASSEKSEEPLMDQLSFLFNVSDKTNSVKKMPTLRSKSESASLFTSGVTRLEHSRAASYVRFGGRSDPHYWQFS